MSSLRPRWCQSSCSGLDGQINLKLPDRIQVVVNFVLASTQRVGCDVTNGLGDRGVDAQDGFYLIVPTAYNSSTSVPTSVLGAGRH